MTAPLIIIEELSVRYPRTAQPALRDLHLTIGRGEALLLLGPSGSGKSTLGLCLAGLIPDSIPAAQEGRVLLTTEGLLSEQTGSLGQMVNAAELPLGQRTALIGMVFQDPESQFCMLTVEDEVAFGLENLAVPREQMDGRIEEALDTVGLMGRRHERLDRLSGGQKQRLALACALARRPPILFLDEPTSNLDPAARSDFYRLLAALRRQRRELTLIIVEHVLDDLIGIIDRIALLGRDGRLHGEGQPAVVFEREENELDQLGIWLPQVTALGQRLRRAGLDLRSLPLNVEQAASGMESLLAHRCVAAPHRSLRAGPAAAEARQLTFSYTPGRPVLHGVSLAIPEGTFMALSGPNASGKTTLASQWVDVLRPAEGHAFLFGDDVTTLTTAQITERAGFVFQNPEHQFVARSVEDELAYSLQARHRPALEIKGTVERLLGEFGLAPHRHRSPFSLSQGQKRRLSVATMLAVGQRLLVLDEPTFGQDRHSAGALMQRLCGLHRQGITLLIISHDMQVVADYAEQVAVLVEGRLFYNGATAELFTDPSLLESASLRGLPMHDLARGMGVQYVDGTLPMSLRDWLPFFGLTSEPGPLSVPASQEAEG